MLPESNAMLGVPLTLSGAHLLASNYDIQAGVLIPTLREF